VQSTTATRQSMGSVAQRRQRQRAVMWDKHVQHEVALFMKEEQVTRGRQVAPRRQESFSRQSR